jgi:PD-(D/E)XK nuclease superfamily protein
VTTPPLAKRRQSSGGRTYAWPPLPPHEFEVISSTNAVENGLPKPYLIGWAAKMTAECAVDDHKIIAAMLEKGDEQSALQHLKGARNRNRDAKADRGTVVHSALEAYMTGKPLDEEDIKEALKEKRVPTKMWKPTLQMVKGVMEFLSDEEPEVYWSEKTVFSRTHEYAGTPDLIARARVGGTMLPVIIDVKTSKSIYDETALQLVSYARAEFVGLDDGTEAPLLPTDESIDFGIVVRPLARPSKGRLYEKGVFTLTDPVFDLFLSCANTSRLKGMLDSVRRPS